MTQPLGEEFILIKPLLTGFRAELETQLKAALAGVTAKVPVAAARAAGTQRAAVVPAAAATERLAVATTQAATAEQRLAAAAAVARKEVGGIILPAGVRDVVVLSQAAAKAQANLATATKVTKQQLGGIVLPPGIRSVTVATNQAAAAQQNLAKSATAAKAALAAPPQVAGGFAVPPGTVGTGALRPQPLPPGHTVSPAGVVLPPGVTTATTAATKATQQLGTTAKLTNAQLQTLSATSRSVSASTNNLSKNIKTAETAVGRYSRGVVAATVASTGFFRAVSFASGAFLVGAGVGATIGAAVQEFKQMTVVGAQTAAVIKATGESANVTAAQVDELAKRQLRLTGTDDELIKSSANILLTFRSIRNEVGAGNDVFNRAVKAVQDISSVFNTDMRGSAVQVGKALQDPIRGVTALRRSGITLSQSQRDLVKTLVETGRQFTAQKLILNEIERQVGGTAEAIGQTLPGQLAILRESAKNSLGEFVKRISESRDAAQVFSETTGGIGDAFAAIIPPIAAAGKAIGISVSGAEKLNVLRPLVKTVTLLAVAFGAMKLALGAASAASTLYVRATTIQTAASAAAGAAAEAQALALGATAAAASAAGTAAAASAARVGLLAGAMNLLRGPLGIAIGITAVTIGFVKLRDVLANAPGTINATRKALDGLSDAVERAKNLSGSLAGAREDVSVARFDVLAGQRAVSGAQAAVQASPAQQGSIEQLGLANRLVDAQNKLIDANKALAAAEQRRDRIEGQIAQNQRSRQFVIAGAAQSLQDQIDTLSQRQIHLPFVGDITVPISDARHSVSRFNDLMDKLIAKGTPLDQQVGRVLKTVAQTIGDIPPRKDVTLAVRLIGQGRSLDEVLSILGAGRGTEAIRARGITPPPSFRQQQEEALRAAEAAVRVEQKRLATIRDIQRTRQQDLATAREQTDAARQALQAAQDQQASARQALADARQAAREARQSVVDTIAAGKLAIADAVTSAKSNLDQLGQAIAQALGEAGATISGSLSPERFAAIKERIRAGAGGPDTQQVRQQLQSEIQGGAAAAAPDVTRKFADLTDALNRGKLTLPQFTRQFNALLKGIDFKKIRQQQGAAAANLLRDQIAAFRAQARLITQGPQRAGGGARQTLIDPATAVKQAALDVAASQRQLSASLRNVRNSQQDLQRSNEDLRRAEIRVRTAQSEETRANTRAIRAHTRVLEQQNALLRAQRAKQDKPKANNKAAKDAGDINLVGANSP